MTMVEREGGGGQWILIPPRPVKRSTTICPVRSVFEDCNRSDRKSVRV